MFIHSCKKPDFFKNPVSLLTPLKIPIPKMALLFLTQQFCQIIQGSHTDSCAAGRKIFRFFLRPTGSGYIQMNPGVSGINSPINKPARIIFGPLAPAELIRSAISDFSNSLYSSTKGIRQRRSPESCDACSTS